MPQFSQIKAIHRNHGASTLGLALFGKLYAKLTGFPFDQMMDVWLSTRPKADYSCVCCDYHGPFLHSGSANMAFQSENRCPHCNSLGRDRLFQLACEDKEALGAYYDLPQPILHFAPEPILKSYLKQRYSDYITSCYTTAADHRFDMQAIGLEDASCGTVIANHVLEHVPDDRLAMAELFRILRPGGLAILSVPIIEGWDETYENPAIQSEKERMLHFLQGDHLRLYGHNFKDIVQEAGFEIFHEYVADGARSVLHNLRRGEKLFFFVKPE